VEGLGEVWREGRVEREERGEGVESMGVEWKWIDVWMWTRQM
jgi:hypothetical protein